MLAYLMDKEELNQSITTRELTGQNSNKVDLVHKTCEYIKDHNVPVPCVITLKDDPNLPKNCPKLQALFPELAEKMGGEGPMIFLLSWEGRRVV